MPDLDPPAMPGARECQAYTLDASGHSLTVWVDVGPELRLFVLRNLMLSMSPSFRPFGKRMSGTVSSSTRHGSADRLRPSPG